MKMTTPTPTLPQRGPRWCGVPVAGVVFYPATPALIHSRVWVFDTHFLGEARKDFVNVTVDAKGRDAVEAGLLEVDNDKSPVTAAIKKPIANATGEQVSLHTR